MTPRPVGRPPKSGQLVHLRLPKKLYYQLKQRADHDGRSFTKTVELLLAAALQKGNTQ